MSITRPYLYYINRAEPFVVMSVQTAASGRVAMTRYKPDNEYGKHAVIGFRIALASDILAWQTSAEAGSKVTFSGISGNFMFVVPGGIQYQNELSSEIDINNIPTGFDFWRGILRVIKVP